MNQQTHDKSQTPLEASERFRSEPTRRDFLGLAAIWAGIVTFATAAIGALRLPMPSVFPESNSQVKLGPPKAFAMGSATPFTHLNLWVFRDQKGLYAISSVCTHLGCITARDSQTGHYQCPCHGSAFDEVGNVVKGPAPSPLHWLEMSIAPDGQIMVDTQKKVASGTRLVV